MLIYFISLARSDIAYRRKFFEDYAKKNNFDPLNPENWYSRTKDIMETKVGLFKKYYQHYYKLTSPV